MIYMGSKRRIANEIIPVMLPYCTGLWVEPFVGGGNLIDKIPNTVIGSDGIVNIKKIGYDLNPHTISSLIDIRDNLEILPEHVSEEDYKSYRGLPAGSVTSWVRFVCSFGGDFKCGYARNTENRNYALVGKRNAISQSPNLQNVELIHGGYDSVVCEGAVIYCDPPYQDTTGYKTGKFDHVKFFDWCREMAKTNTVFVSEYNCPDDFILVWEGKQTTNINNKSEKKSATEKLFRVP